jgi:O-antigen ligase
MFDGPLLLILLAAFISMFVGDHLRESLRVLRTVILEPILFYVMLIDTVKRPASIMWCIIALIVGGCLISLVAIAQWVSASNVITAEGVIRSRGFYGSPNNLGLVLERTIPLAACGVIVFRDYRWWWAGASALMLVAVVLTFSWGAWFALGVSALFLGFVGGRRRAMVVLVSVISVMAALLLLAGPERLASHLSLEQGTTFIRLRLWEASLLMLRDHPLFGVGLDNFLYLYRELYVFDDAIIDLELSHPHNIVLDYWLNLGILGLFAGGWLLWRFFNVGWRSYNYLPETSRRALVLGLLASMIAAFTHGLVDNFFFLVDLAVLFWFMCAMMHTLSGKNEGMEWI